jgi:DNA-binding MarR family transcriptional regulator
MAKTRWLDDDQQATWRSYLKATSMLTDAIAAQLQEDSGLPHTYYEILVQLSEAPDHSLRMSELAARALSSRSRLSHAVARLAEQGWVERLDCPTDRRGQIARLTDTGYAALKAAAPGHAGRVLSGLFDALSQEQARQLKAIADAIAANLDGEQEHAPNAAAASA